MPEDDLRIDRVEVPTRGTKTWRTLNGDHGSSYQVALGLSRALDDFERLAVVQSTRWTIGPDSTTIVFDNTALEAIRQHLPGLNGQLIAAARTGRQMRDAAEREDARLLALADEINERLANG